MKKFFKIFGIAVLFLILLAVIAGWIASKPFPQGHSPEAADQLADRMLESLGYEAYQEIDTLEWSFFRGHHFVWNKTDNLVEVRWEENRVLLDPDTQTGEAFVGGQQVQGGEQDKLVGQAWKFFANDSFWLIAPFKVKDPGTSRLLVDLEEEGKKGLMVTYSSGGVTPGDSYLWILDESNRPVAWRMWVGILPIKGIETSWEGWKNVEGAWIATEHKGAFGMGMELELVPTH